MTETQVPPRSTFASGELYRRLIRNFSYLAGGTGAAGLFNLVALAIISRALSPKEFGLLLLLQSSALALGGIVSFGTQQPVIQLGSVAFEHRDFRRLGSIIGYGLSVDVAAALTAAVAGMAIVLLAGELIGISADERTLGMIFAVSLLFNGYLTSNGVFRLFNRFGLLSSIQAGSAALGAILAAILYASGAGLMAFVLMWAGTRALATQAQLWVALGIARNRGIPLSLRSSPQRESDFRHFFAYCWSTWGTASTEALRINGDSILTGALVSVEAVGLYNVAKQLAGMIRKIGPVYAGALFPEVTSLAASRDAKGSARLRRRMLLVGAGVGAAGIGVIALIGIPLLRFGFAERFVAAYWALLLLAAAAALQLINQTVSIYVQVYLGPARLLLLYILATLAFIAAAPVLILLFGIEGAALAQVLFVVALIAFCAVALRGSALKSGVYQAR